ncbi:hypothetical protein OF83DRAFT_206224 [Amylostereum chailletii]|nr:hypothetical protein OF83DRAFT_206224 [Amylostereum chailletii]
MNGLDAWFDSDSNSEEDEEVELLAAIILYGTDEAGRLRRLRRQVTRRYLTRPELLSNPRNGTPWQVLYASQNDRAFVTTMGFNCATFDLLLQSGFSQAWNTTPIPRGDTNSNGQPRIGARSLDAAGALGLALHYLASAAHETSYQQIFALIPSTVDRYISFSITILLGTVKNIPEGEIRWPEGQEFEEWNGLIVARHELLTGGFGSLDGLKLAVQESDDPDIENATYNGWTHGHYESSVFAFSPRGVIFCAAINLPDTAFPRGTQNIAGRIKAPLKANAVLPEDPQELAALRAFNRQLLSYRQTAEWGMRALQGSFGRLRVPLKIDDDNGRADLIELCARLSNIRALCVGVSEIRNVYEPLWRDEDDELWFQFENMMIGEIRRRDRVSRFHRL